MRVNEGMRAITPSYGGRESEREGAKGRQRRGYDIEHNNIWAKQRKGKRQKLEKYTQK
jgi:hypothetical protein